MKILILAALFICNVFSCYAQGIKPASGGKAVVYFVRISSLGAIVDFTFFDSNNVIGRFNSKNYMRYECAPGEHLFWAYSENKDFVTADLEAGKIYFIDADPEMGAFQAQVRLLPVDPNDTKKMEKIEKIINERMPRSMSPGELEQSTKKLAKTITRSLDKYHADVVKGRKYKRLERTMGYKKNE
jgi:hypothetical protein